MQFLARGDSYSNPRPFSAKSSPSLADLVFNRAIFWMVWRSCNNRKKARTVTVCHRAVDVSTMMRS
jgi:hypothetical protein